MAIIPIKIPDEQLDRVLDAMCDEFGYQSMANDSDGAAIENPESKRDFVKRKLHELIKGVVERHEFDSTITRAQDRARKKLEKEPIL